MSDKELVDRKRKVEFSLFPRSGRPPNINTKPHAIQTITEAKVLVDEIESRITLKRKAAEITERLYPLVHHEYEFLEKSFKSHGTIQFQRKLREELKELRVLFEAIPAKTDANNNKIYDEYYGFMHDLFVSYGEKIENVLKETKLKQDIDKLNKDVNIDNVYTGWDPITLLLYIAKNQTFVFLEFLYIIVTAVYASKTEWARNNPVVIFQLVFGVLLFLYDSSIVVFYRRELSVQEKLPFLRRLMVISMVLNLFEVFLSWYNSNEVIGGLALGILCIKGLHGIYIFQKMKWRVSLVKRLDSLLASERNKNVRESLAANVLDVESRLTEPELPKTFTEFGDTSKLLSIKKILSRRHEIDDESPADESQSKGGVFRRFRKKKNKKNKKTT